jgi:hypothetical protein
LIVTSQSRSAKVKPGAYRRFSSPPPSQLAYPGQTQEYPCGFLPTESATRNSAADRHAAVTAFRVAHSGLSDHGRPAASVPAFKPLTWPDDIFGKRNAASRR